MDHLLQRTQVSFLLESLTNIGWLSLNILASCYLLDPRQWCLITFLWFLVIIFTFSTQYHLINYRQYLHHIVTDWKELFLFPSHHDGYAKYWWPTSLFFLFFNQKIQRIPYLRTYKPHFFDQYLPSKIAVRLMHGILCHFDDWVRDAGIVCCEKPSRDR
jgi:hypothetical protein